MNAAWLQPEQYENVLGALALLVVLALVLERALALFFEWGPWREWLEQKRLRAPLAFVAAYVLCVWGQFDVFSVIFAKPGGYEGALSFGTFATAAVLAGGSKGAILLFQGVLGFGREAVNARIALRSAPPTPPGQG